MTLTHLSSGDWFGEISIIDDNPRTHDAWTTNKVTLLSIPRQVIIHTAGQHPILYKHLALITCGRIRRAFDWIDDATSLNTSARLASMLMGLIGTYGKQVNGDIKIDLRLSQEELGFMLGTTRQTHSTSSVHQNMSEQEWEMRVNLAACYRIIASYGWDDLVFTHISARVPGTEDEFLINPYGMLFEEITASNLVKVNKAGEKLAPSEFDVNPAGFIIHSAVHEARDDAHCVIHLHTNDGVAVSAQEQGLLPISQQSLFPLSNLAYHGYVKS